MEDSYLNLMKLNRFLFFSEAPSSSLQETILEHLKEWAMAISNLFVSLLDKLNQAFPPESRPQWLDASAPYLIAGVVILCLLLLLYCCVVPLLTWLLFTCWRFCKWFWRRCCCCCCCRRRRRRMMTAPGTWGEFLIERADFEADPRDYFRSLRARTLPVTHRLR